MASAWAWTHLRPSLTPSKKIYWTWKKLEKKRLIIRNAKESNGSEEQNQEKSFNPFGFVTDNPSSRSAIQLPESPAEDGNVGQMLYVSFSLLLLSLYIQSICFMLCLFVYLILQLLYFTGRGLRIRVESMVLTSNLLPTSLGLSDRQVLLLCLLCFLILYAMYQNCFD